MLGLVGGACGMALASVAVQILKAQDLTAIPRLAEVSVDSATLAFGIACSVTGSLLFGFIAVWKSGIPGKVVHTRGASMSLEQRRAQNVLVVVQIALASVLLVASGLLIRSYVAVRGVYPGFSHSDRIQTMRIVIPETQVPEPERVARMQTDIVEKISILPGVEAVAFADGLPMDMDYRNGIIVSVEGRFVPGQTAPNRTAKTVSPKFFATLGTRLLAGRDFTWEDMLQRRRVAIVSENMARENWGDPNAALGKRLRQGTLGDTWFEVVGVVENVHDDGSNKPAPPIVYPRAGVNEPTRPGRPTSIRRGMTLAIRSSRAGSEGLIRQVAAIIQSVNPSLPLAQVRTHEDVYRRSMARTSFTLILLGVAGTMALVLAIVGVYGVLAYSVLQRRREVSIRAALGAQPHQVKGLFVQHGMLLACSGFCVGLLAATGFSRWIASLLYGVTPLDPATYATSGIVVRLAALIASYIPANRAASTNPAQCLRAD